MFIRCARTQLLQFHLWTIKPWPLASGPWPLALVLRDFECKGWWNGSITFNVLENSRNVDGNQTLLKQQHPTVFNKWSNGSSSSTLLSSASLMDVERNTKAVLTELNITNKKAARAHTREMFPNFRSSLTYCMITSSLVGGVFNTLEKIVQNLEPFKKIRHFF